MTPGIAFGLAIVAAFGLMAAGMATFGCDGICQVLCRSSICPLDPDAAGDSCKCPRKCPAGLSACATDADCVVIDEFCCAEPDITHPKAINKAFMVDYGMWQANECADGEVAYASQDSVTCEAGCRGRCREKLIPVCKNNGYCDVPYGQGTAYAQCMEDCEAVEDDGGWDAGDALQDGGVGDCAFPLTAYCASDCPTYDESVDNVRGTCDVSQNAYAAVGTCGDYRFTVGYDTMEILEWFFDESGTLVSMRQGTDYNAFCDLKSNFQTFGPVPDCTKNVTEKFCGVW
jgi:hypothetical protein